MSIVSFIAASPFALLGLHLARVAHRSGAVPDRLLAAFFLLIAAGIPPRMTAVDLATSGTGTSWTSFWLNTTANGLMGIGLVCLAAFAWQVFRPRSSWAKGLVVGLGVAIAAAILTAATSLEASQGSGPAAIAFSGLGVAAILWTFVECVLYYSGIRRRLALGMADPIVTNRFLLWSIWTGALAFQGIATAILRLALWWTGAGEVLAAGEDPGGPWLALIQVVKGLLAIVAPTAVVTVVLSFTPPARYRRWLESRQPEPLNA
jgi:hypothetical protein